MVVSVPCPSCSTAVHFGDDFCSSCGASIGKELKRALRERLEASDSSARARAVSIRKASAALLWLAGAFVVGGVILFVSAQSTAEQALLALNRLPADGSLAVEGKTYVVSELRAIVAREPYQILGVNVGLAAIMVALYFWSRRNPVAALVTALALYLTVTTVSAVLDPKTLFMGIVLKILAVVLFVRGIRAALESRHVERGPT